MLQQPGQTVEPKPAGQVGWVAVEPVEQPIDQRLFSRRADHSQASPLAGQLVAGHGQPLHRPAPPRVVRPWMQDDQRPVVAG